MPIDTPSKPKRKKYLTNKSLLEQLELSHQQKQMTNELAKMLIMLVHKVAGRQQYAMYSYREEMEGYALVILTNTWDKFNPEKTNNPFAYFTRIIMNAFVYILNAEKKHQNIRDALLVSVGLDPSFAYEEKLREQNEETTSEKD